MGWLEHRGGRVGSVGRPTGMLPIFGFEGLGGYFSHTTYWADSARMCVCLAPRGEGAWGSFGGVLLYVGVAGLG